MRLLVVSPAFFGSGTGAATYYKILSSELLRCGLEVAVVSDAEPGSGEVERFPLFPRRSVRDRHLLRDAAALAWQQACYARLPSIASRFRPDVVLVHDSFFNFPGPFEWAVRIMRRRLPGARWIVDVRGRQLPKRQVPKLAALDAAIACSQNVADFLVRGGVPSRRVVQVPVIQERLEADIESTDVVARVGLEGQRYILYGGLIKPAKRVDRLIRAFSIVRAEHPDVILALAGPMKEQSREFLALTRSDGVRLLGTLPRRDLLAVMSQASLCAHVSDAEGLPRFVLEALALGRPCVLPPSVPEFRRLAPQLVAGDKPEDIAEQLLGQLQSGSCVDTYPIHRHYPENVIPLYLRTFRETD